MAILSPCGLQLVEGLNPHAFNSDLLFMNSSSREKI